MKKLALLCFVAVGFCVSANPDETALQGFARWGSAEMASAARALSADAAKDPHHFASKRIADFPNEYFLLVHREADGAPEVHETEIDVILIQSGTGTFVVGGTLQNGETTAPHEKRNGTIVGGTKQKVTAGDVMRVPPNTPHQMLLDGAKELNYLVVKVKGY
jgi:mannose-6-phosphate isomerase-like protein (cupin superfamily)